MHEQNLKAYNATRPENARNKLCHGPWRGMFFTFDGAARACCLNGNFRLGRYPDQSIAGIWASAQTRALRGRIAKNDLSLACFACGEHLASGNFDAMHARMFDHLPDNANGLPSVMSFEISNECPLQCVMCTGMFSSAIRRHREKRPPAPNPYGPEFADQLEAFIPSLSQMKFFGGEPFLVDAYWDIWERALRIKPEAVLLVQTGTCAWSPKIKSLLARGRFDINVSIDSLDKATYESIRVGSRLETVMENLGRYVDYARANDRFLGIAACPMRLNWRGLPDIVDLCNRLGVPVYFNTVFRPARLALWSLPSQDLAAMIAALSVRDFPQDTPNQAKNRTHFLDFLKQLSLWQDEAAAMERGLAGLAPGSMERLRARLKIKLAKDFPQDRENQGPRLDKVMDRISRTLELLPPPISREAVLRHLNAAHPGLVLRGYENNPARELAGIVEEDLVREPF